MSHAILAFKELKNTDNKCASAPLCADESARAHTDTCTHTTNTRLWEYSLVGRALA